MGVCGGERVMWECVKVKWQWACGHVWRWEYVKVEVGMCESGSLWRWECVEMGVRRGGSMGVECMMPWAWSSDGHK